MTFSPGMVWRAKLNIAFRFLLHCGFELLHAKIEVDYQMKKLDLHVHTEYSKDCSMKLEKIIGVARGLGLDGIAIADHNSARGGFEAKRLAGEDFTVIPGEEVLTDRGEVLCLFLCEEIGAKEFFEVVDEAHSQGALCFATHPFDPFRLNRLRGIESLYRYLDGIEAFNARCAFESFNHRARRFAEDKGLLMIAGSDAHTYGEIGLAGVGVESIEDIRKGGAAIFGRSSSFAELIKTKIYKSLGREV